MTNEFNSLVGFDNFTVDTKKKIVWCEEEPLKLPLKAVEVLCVLIENTGKVLSKEDLLNAVWQDSFVEEGVLPQNIYRLRKIFKKYGSENNFIETIPSRGYRFTAELSEIIEEEISIERSTFEKKFVAERITPDEDFSHVETDGQISAETYDRQATIQPQTSLFNKKNLAYLGLILLSFSVIGAGVWFWKSPNSNRKNFSLIKDNLEIERLTESGTAYFPAVSRDNQHLAYIRNENNKYALILQHLPTKSETVVIEPQEFRIRSLNFSADGNYLFYVTREPNSRESTIHQIPIYGGTRRSLVTNVRDLFTLSPDGKQFAYYRLNSEKRRTDLLVSDIDGSNEKLVASRKYPNYYKVWDVYPAWSPDGKRLVTSAYISPNKDKTKNSHFLLEYDIETGEEKVLRSEEWKIPYQAFYLKDGSGLIVLATDKFHKQLWHISYPDSKVSRITNDTNNYEYFKLSDDTNSIITTIETQFSNLYTISLENKDEVKQITKQNSAIYGHKGLDWTQDGKELVFVKSEGSLDGDLWKINLETLETKQITFDKEFLNRFPNTTPDGKSVIFASTREGNSQIWQIDLDGQNLKQITNRGIGANNPELSKDGKTLFYTTPAVGASKFWKVSMAGGKYERILGVTGGQNRVSPSDQSKVISYHFDRSEKENPWKYMLLSHESQDKLQKLNFDAENHSYEWSKDSKGVYFPFKSENQNNLWFLSITDNKAEQFTNFTTQKITNLSISPDGETVAVSRGDSRSNILRISGF